MGALITVGQTAWDAYGLYKKIKKAKTYYNDIRGALDEDTRSGALFKLAMDGTESLMKLGAKAFGADLLAKHPYFKMHKAHIELLVRALNASDVHNAAMQALSSAIQSADAAESLTQALDAYTARKNAYKWEYNMYLDGALRTQAELRTNPAQAESELKDAGQTADSLRENTEYNLKAWRAHNCELFVDAVQLLAMVDVEYRATAVAMARYNEKMKKLQQGTTNLDYIAGKGAEKKRDEEQAYRELERLNHPKSRTPSPQAVQDPTGFAERQRDKVADVVGAIATICDVAMSDDAYNPDQVNLKTGSL